MTEIDLILAIVLYCTYNSCAKDVTHVYVVAEFLLRSSFSIGKTTKNSFRKMQSPALKIYLSLKFHYTEIVSIEIKY